MIDRRQSWDGCQSTSSQRVNSPEVQKPYSLSNPDWSFCLLCLHFSYLCWHPRPCLPSCPFPVDTIKTRSGDWSIRLDDLTVTKGKLACCRSFSGPRSAKVGLFSKPDLELPLHPPFLYLSFSHAFLRGGSRRILYITVNSLLEGRPE